MEFLIDVLEAQKAVKVLSVVVKNNADDSTGRVLIEATENSVVFMANNGITALSLTADNVEIIETGKTALAYSKIKTFVSAFKAWDGETGAKVFNFKVVDNNTILTVNNKNLNGKVSKGRLKLANFNPNLMSGMPKFNNASFSLNSTIFRNATNKVLYAINPSLDFSQPSLQGMHVTFDEENIYFAGSDGVVLSEYQVKNVSEYVDEALTLQYDFIMGLRRILTDNIQLLWEIEGNKINVHFDNIVFTGRRIVGHEYPDYKAALDKYTDYVNLSKELFVSALTPFVDVLESEDNFRVTLDIKDKMLTIYNVQAKFEVELEIAGGLDFSIDLNGRHLIQTIEAIKDDHILFKFSDSDGFAIFDSSTFNDQKALISSIRKR